MGRLAFAPLLVAGCYLSHVEPPAGDEEGPHPPLADPPARPIDPWQECSDYRDSGGRPGDPCSMGSFLECNLGCPDEQPGEWCCGPLASCVDGRVSEENPCVEPHCPDGGGSGCCRVDADCDASGWFSGQLCLPPSMTPEDAGLCCVVHPAERTCGTDADCQDDFVCVESRAPCSDGPSASCVASCLQAGCPAGERCRLEGRCSPTPCALGFECPASKDCAPEDDEADPHGCVRRTCTVDGHCGWSGACVLGRCDEGPMTCVSAGC